MDNLTHSLIGAAIGQTGLKKLSGLGMATLIIAANIPDIDAACFLWLDGHEHLAFRRGITHGPLAMLILPALLTAAMVGFDRWQTRRGTRPDARLPVRPLQLFLLALIGCLSHPAFDWLNNYGIRLLEPFSSRWFYGDTLFIIDVWLWAILIGGWFWSRRAEKRGGHWRRRGQVVATLVGLYVFANGVITGKAEGQALLAWHQRMEQAAPGATFADPLMVASVEPLFFWERKILWRGDGVYGQGTFSLFNGVQLQRDSRDGRGALMFAEPTFADGEARRELNRRAQSNSQLAAYLFWSRMPVTTTFVRDGQYWQRIGDQRFADPRISGRFTVEYPLGTAASETLPGVPRR